MPVQTQKKSNIYFPDGAQVLVKTKADEEFFDVGAINSAVNATVNWTESSVETANAGTLDTKISDMQIAGGFTLINLDPEGVAKMGGGVFKLKRNAAEGPVTPSPQIIKGGIKKGIVYPLTMVDPSGGREVRPLTTPVITSVMAGPGKSSPIAAETGYVLTESATSPSGWGIVFTQAGAESNESNDITITYNSNTVVGGTSIACGGSSVVLKPYAMRVVHTDDNGKKRSLDLYSVYSNSGGFQFNFKGANEDGVEEMPLTFTAKLDTSRTNNEQLMTWSVEEGAN